MDHYRLRPEIGLPLPALAIRTHDLDMLSPTGPAGLGFQRKQVLANEHLPIPRTVLAADLHTPRHVALYDGRIPGEAGQLVDYWFTDDHPIGWEQPVHEARQLLVVGTEEDFLAYRTSGAALDSSWIGFAVLIVRAYSTGAGTGPPR